MFVFRYGFGKPVRRKTLKITRFTGSWPTLTRFLCQAPYRPFELCQAHALTHRLRSIHNHVVKKAYASLPRFPSTLPLARTFIVKPETPGPPLGRYFHVFSFLALALVVSPSCIESNCLATCEPSASIQLSHPLATPGTYEFNSPSFNCTFSLPNSTAFCARIENGTLVGLNLGAPTLPANTAVTVTRDGNEIIRTTLSLKSTSQGTICGTTCTNTRYALLVPDGVN